MFNTERMRKPVESQVCNKKNLNASQFYHNFIQIDLAANILYSNEFSIINSVMALGNTAWGNDSK